MEKESLTIKLAKSSFSTSSINIIEAKPQNVYLVKSRICHFKKPVHTEPKIKMKNLLKEA